MKRLYPILLFLLCAACSGPTSSEAEQRATPTIPPEWLTKPPTPELTAGAPDQASSTNEVPTRASPTDAAATELPSPEPVATATNVFEIQLPDLFGRYWTVSTSPGIPEEFLSSARAMAAERPNDFLWVEPGSLPTDITMSVGGREPLAEWTYVAAVPFATLEDDISLVELQDLWSGSASAERKLIVTADVLVLLERLWGEPDTNVETADAAELGDALWAQQPSLTILPFHKLTPDLKVLRLDGNSPLDLEFSDESYPLTVEYGVDGEQDALAAFIGAWSGDRRNFDPQKLTRVAMTGVTALVRATATQMEIDGILAPAADVGPILRAADIAHISNEVSFSADCPEPNPVSGTSFCSQDEYFALLEEIGTDVIELTGNHLNDWGAENVLRTIDMYEAAGMNYFGGGRDAADAQKATLIDHNGNRIAMVGCNYFGPSYAWATETTAGSRECGPDFYEQIAWLDREGFVVIATQQYTEYYQYPPMPEQQADFRAIADAGAAAVSGSQGHHAQGFEFHDGAFIHYGLGNLFFDQMDMLGTRQAFVDIYNIYDGRLINVDLWTGLIENFFLPREMTTAERQEALQSVFQASGW